MSVTYLVLAPSRGPQHSIRTRARALALAIAA
jgi:hypothetical protein